MLEFRKQGGSVPVAIDGATFVSERFGFAYLCVPKTLSRAMLKYLVSVDPDGYRLVDRDPSMDTVTSTAVTNAWKSFTFVRSPYSRAVAVYFDKFVNYRHAPGQRALFARYPGIRPDMTFSEFVDWLASEEGSDRTADPHFLSQHYFVLDAKGDPATDYVGKVEEAERDALELQALLGLPPEPMPRVNTNASRERVSFDTSRRWHEVLDDRSKRTLANRYDGDFELFGYERLPFRTIPRFLRPGGGTAASRSPMGKDRVFVKKVLAFAGLEVRRSRRQAG